MYIYIYYIVGFFQRSDSILLHDGYVSMTPFVTLLDLRVALLAPLWYAQSLGFACIFLEYRGRLMLHVCTCIHAYLVHAQGLKRVACTYLNLYTCIYIYMYNANIQTYTYIHIYIYREREREQAVATTRQAYAARSLEVLCHMLMHRNGFCG